MTLYDVTVTLPAYLDEFSNAALASRGGEADNPIFLNTLRELRKQRAIFDQQDSLIDAWQGEIDQYQGEINTAKARVRQIQKRTHGFDAEMTKIRREYYGGGKCSCLALLGKRLFEFDWAAQRGKPLTYQGDKK